jgi:hypothetical protein
MAPSTITYGRKISLNMLSSFGSRRRERDPKNASKTYENGISLQSTSEQNVLTVIDGAIIAMKAYFDDNIPPTQGIVKNYDDTIDEMASALLDDANTLRICGEWTRRQEHKAQGTPSKENEPSLAQRHLQHGVPILPPLQFSPAASPDNYPPDIRRAVSPCSRSPDYRLRPSRIEKQSPVIPRKSSKRRTAERPYRDSIQLRKESGLTRPLPQSRTTFMGQRKSGEARLPSSASVPLRRIATQLDGRLPAQRKPGTADAEEINQKVMAMLAATNALKPQESNQPDSPAPSKISRMMSSKVFSKVTTALERFHSKGSAKESKIRGTIKHPFPVDIRGEITSENAPAPIQNESPISSIEIRLNEGSNLNKSKVKQIVGGGRVFRKPVAEDGKSLRGSSCEDPFAETGSMGRTPTRFEHRLKTGTESGDDSSVLHTPGNPFESENGFDTDLNGVLSSSPLAWSTPRIVVQRPYSVEDSPTKPGKAMNLRGGGDELLINDAEGDEEVLPHANVEPLTLCERRLGDGAKRLSHNSVDLSVRVNDDEPQRMKKHPSPSKEVLENLEREFQTYAELQKLQLGGALLEDKDELANSFVPPSGSARVLSPRDKNRLMKHCSSSTADSDSSSIQTLPTRKHTSARPQSLIPSRIPRPVEAAKLRPKTRFGLLSCPAQAGAMEVDELQWDVATFSLGPRHVY